MVVVVLVLVVVLVAAVVVAVDDDDDDDDATAADGEGTVCGMVPVSDPFMLSLAAAVDGFDGSAPAVAFPIVVAVDVILLLSSPPAAIATELLLLAPLLLLPTPPAPLLPLLLLLLLVVVCTNDCNAGVAIFNSFSIEANLAVAFDSSIRNGFNASVASLLRVATTNASTSSTTGGTACAEDEVRGWVEGSPSFSAASR